MVTIRKKDRECVPDFFAGRIEGGDRFYFSTGIGNSKDHILGSPAEQNDAIAAPGDTVCPGGVADDLGRPSGDIDLLQLAVSYKAEMPAIRRPEHRVETLRARNLPGLFRVDAANPCATLAFSRLNDEGDLPSIRRNRHGIADES